MHSRSCSLSINSQQVIQRSFFTVRSVNARVLGTSCIYTYIFFIYSYIYTSDFGESRNVAFRLQAIAAAASADVGLIARKSCCSDRFRCEPEEDSAFRSDDPRFSFSFFFFFERRRAACFCPRQFSRY